MSVSVTGVQSVHDRFGRGDDLDHLPYIAQWRCNVTGLSQTHNLYFIAYGKDIYVYVPEFPTQAISTRPVLIFTSQPSSPDLTGYLDPRRPHCINSLLVEFLGTEEVVAVVRDDGDVDAFLVRHIVQAIERRAESESTIGVQGDEVRPFFQSNVIISAWGLAIHSHARILAISSNAHEVRVFKFGLLQSGESGEDLSDDDDDILLPDADRSHPESQRETDVTHHVLNGEANIPYISFCNTGDDPEARWLLTTDISGVCRVMDLHALQAVQAFRFGRSFVLPSSSGFDRLNAGWGIMFLDKRSFLAENDVYQALGMGDDESLPGIRRSGVIWDLSKTTKSLTESSEPFFYHTAETLGREARTEMELGVGDETNVSVSALHAVHNDSSGFDSDSDSDGGAPVDIEIEMSLHDEESGQDDSTGSEFSDPGDDAEDAGSMPSLPGTFPDDSGPPSVDDLSGFDVDLIHDDIDPYDEGTEDTFSHTSFYNGDSICGNEPRFTNTGPICDGLPCPILHASVRNVYLLQPSEQYTRVEDGSASPFNPPLMGFANPLGQSIQAEFEYLRFFERLNMNAYIRELGLVVVASQKGRAVVLALTKIQGGTKRSSAVSTSASMGPTSYPPEMASYAGKTNYCMHVVAILPFAHQEKKNERPFAPLHGIAVAPLQGSGDGNGEGGGPRYRLMMMYQDHSILSYELRRPTRHGGSERKHTRKFTEEELIV